MTTGNLYQQGQAPDESASPATLEDLNMGRFKIGPKIPAAVLEKIGMKVGDTIPEDHDPDQVERWNRRGYLVTDGGKTRETAQKGGAETRGKAAAKKAAPKKKAAAKKKAAKKKGGKK